MAAPLEWSRWWAWSVLVFLFTGPAVLRAQVVLQALQTSSPDSSVADLAGVVAGKKEASPGWRVRADGDSGPKAAVFRFQRPLSARRMRAIMDFQASSPGAFFRAFTLLATNDANPSLDGHWEPFFPVWFHSSQGELIRQGDAGLRLTGAASSPDFRIDFSPPFEGVTGLRIDVSNTGSEKGPRMAVLTRLNVSSVNTATTNVALGCPVKSPGPLPEGTRPGFLTDGIEATSVPLPELREGGSSYFEIDLKRTYDLDHLLLRTRPDAGPSGRPAEWRVRLYEGPPGSGAIPAWEALYQADGSPAELGRSEFRDVIRAKAGQGIFTGRYLRISSDSPQSSSAIAEVEAYESLIPLGVTAREEDAFWQAGDMLKIPATSSWLTFAIDYPLLTDPVGLGRRWRIAGFHDDWQVGTGKGEVESRCPPPGRYEFQAQIRHSDSQWNDTFYRVPLIIAEPFWQTSAARVGGGLLAVALVSFLAARGGRHWMARRTAELDRKNELSAERTRIARDMHDAVGSQLTRLAVMHEIVADELALSDEARSKLQELTDTARASVVALDAVVWSVHPGNDTLSQMAGYLTTVAREYLTPLGIACRQDAPHEWPDHPVSSQTRHHVVLAFREVLHNIVKHAGADEVMITLRFAYGVFITRIEDNGIGLPGDTDGFGKDGLGNLHSRLAAIGGTCSLQPRPGGGTLVKMKIPLSSSS